jgi:mono/diheme cytochrome c family protein
VLGFSALQLSPDHDPRAPHAEPPGPNDVDLRGLVARGLVRNLPANLATTPPRIAGRSARERAALGYLHGNCGNCHNAEGPLRRLGLRLDYPLVAGGPPPALATTLGVASGFTRPDASLRIAPGLPAQSVLVLRLAASDALTQMPPFGRHLTDRSALTLIEDWVTNDLAAIPDLARHDSTARKPQ